MAKQSGSKQVPSPVDKPKRKMGRPTRYSLALSVRICARLAVGESLRSVCRDPAMPHIDSVFTWMALYDDFSERYARAKQESADAMAEEILDIADNGTNDYIEQTDDEGAIQAYKVNGEFVQRSKLRVDTRKWLMAKMKPKKYGDRMELGGELGLTHKKFKDMEDDELDAAIEQAAKNTVSGAAS